MYFVRIYSNLIKKGYIQMMSLFQAPLLDMSLTHTWCYMLFSRLLNLYSFKLSKINAYGSIVQLKGCLCTLGLLAYNQVHKMLKFALLEVFDLPTNKTHPFIYYSVLNSLPFYITYHQLSWVWNLKLNDLPFL